MFLSISENIHYQITSKLEISSHFKDLRINFVAQRMSGTDIRCQRQGVSTCGNVFINENLMQCMFLKCYLQPSWHCMKVQRIFAKPHRHGNVPSVPPLPTPLITLHLSGDNATQHSAVGAIVLSICNDLVRLYSVQIEVEMASSSVLLFIIYSIFY